MEIVIKTEKLKSVLSKIIYFTTKHSSLPTLANIFCSLQENKLLFRATNLSIGIEIIVPIKNKEIHDFVIDPKIFNNALPNLKTETDTILKIEENILIIKTGNYTTKIKTLPIDDFPTIPQNTNKKVTIAGSIFNTGLKNVLYATSISDIKPEIASVYIYPDGDDIVFVGTDTFRLAEKRITVKDVYGFSPILIPSKNAQEIARFLEDINEEISIYGEENVFTITTKDSYITSRLTPGTFPNYQQIIPKESKTSITLLKEDLNTILKSITSFSDKFNQITLSVDPKTKQCTVFAKNSEIGEQEVVIDSASTGEAISVNINARYITEMLNGNTYDSISILFSGPTKPIVFKPVGDTSFLYLIMPMSK